MSVKVSIGNGGDSKTVCVDETDTGKNGLLVCTHPYKEYSHQAAFFINSTYGREMNIDAALGGNTENIHDGGDTVYWEASAIAGTWDFNSAAQGFSGSSIDGTATIDNSIAQLSTGSAIELSDYANLVGRIYLTSWSTLGTKALNIYGWDVTGSVQSGSAVNIGDYINTTTLNSWQRFVIPLTEMGITSGSLDGFRIQNIDIGPGLPIDFYLDNIQLVQSASLQYDLKPNLDEWFHVKSLTFSFVDEYSGSLANGTMPAIPYDSFLGVPELGNGVLYQRIVDEEVITANPIRNFYDVVSLPSFNNVKYGSDGTNTWVSAQLVFSTPLVLKAEDKDKLRLTITDDLSGLLKFRVAGSVMVEDRG